MKTILKLGAFLCVVPALGACDMMGGGGQSANQSTNAVTTTNATADTNAAAPAGGKDPGATASGTAGAAPAAGPAPEGGVTRQFLVGRWTDTGDCNNTVTFAQDGSFTSAGGASGLWVLDGDNLTFQGTGPGGSNLSARVQAPDANTIMLIKPDGSIGRSTRCTG
jgi:hypothetical protein